MIKILKNSNVKLTLSLIITTVISFIICNVISNRIRLLNNIGPFAHVYLRLFVSYVIFLSAKWIITKDITKKNKKILYILYFILLIALALSRHQFYGNIYSYNLKLGYINDFSRIVLFANIFMYTPIGFFIKIIVNIKTRNIIILFIIYILIIESLQYVLQVGCFDINDILFNTSGFILGLSLYPILSKIYANKRSK